MDPSSSNSGLELPPPVEAAPAGPSANVPVSGALKVPPNINEAQAAPAPPKLPLAAPATPFLAQQVGDEDTTTTADQQMSEAREHISKVWMNKVKAAVENNRDDPYKQSEAIALIKAEFMKQEFNKTLKLTNK